MDMSKTLKITVDIETARILLGVAGYNTHNMTDTEVFNLALSMNEEYGVKYENP